MSLMDVRSPGRVARLIAAASLCALVSIVTGCMAAMEPGVGRDGPTLGAYVPTPMDVAARMLEMAEVAAADVVYDLGSGDGRIVILAATRHGARGVGVEIDPRLVWFARRDARRARVDHLVSFRHEDALLTDVSPATVVTLYLTPAANRALRPTLLAQLRPGARIVSHAHDMGDWAPDRTEHVRSASGELHALYLWRIPPR